MVRVLRIEARRTLRSYTLNWRAVGRQFSLPHTGGVRKPIFSFNALSELTAHAETYNKSTPSAHRVSDATAIGCGTQRGRNAGRPLSIPVKAT